MTVPFDQLGPGQVGRLAYQVIGKDGPIFNPSNISYLPPRDLPSPVFTSPTAALAGMAGLNLAASVGTLGISGVVLSEVRKVHRELASLDRQIDELAVNLAEVEARVERIDTRVSESHLREALRHCLSSSIAADSIDLTRLVPLIRDIENLENTLEEGLFLNFGVRLSSDVSDQLQSLVSLLSGIRRNVTCLHNRAVGFSPERIVQFKRYDDYLAPQTSLDIAEVAVAVGRIDTTYYAFRDVLGQTVVDKFFFAGEEEKEEFQLLSVEQFYKPYFSAMCSLRTTGMGLELSGVLDRMEVDYSDENAVAVGTDVLRLWMEETDASLLFRLGKELTGIRDGYAEAFYPGLAGGPNVRLNSPVFSLHHAKRKL